MKQVEIHLKIRDSETVIRAIKAFEPVDWMQFQVGQEDRMSIRVLAHDGLPIQCPRRLRRVATGISR